MSIVAQGLAYITAFLNVVLLLFIGSKVVTRFWTFKSARVERYKTLISARSREVAFIIALTAMTGSLYFSNIVGWAPCRLCWYQRILMYPLVVVLGVGVLLKKPDVQDYALPLALIGGTISIYHYIIQMTPIHSSGCSVTGVSCGTQYLQALGYVTVPFMALTAFATIIVLLWQFGDNW